MPIVEPVNAPTAHLRHQVSNTAQELLAMSETVCASVRLPSNSDSNSPSTCQAAPVS